MFARLLIPLGTEERLRIPFSAVHQAGQLDFVYARTPSADERRFVRIGKPDSDGTVIVRSGLVTTRTWWSQDCDPGTVVRPRADLTSWQFESRDGAFAMATHSRSLLAPALALGFLLAGCAARTQYIADANASAAAIVNFCTEANGFQHGFQGIAFTNSCPDSLATAYLDGYQSGYTIFLTQLEVDAMEREIETKSAELARVTATINAATGGLPQRDELQSLIAQQRVIGNQLDELESEVSARKAQLSLRLDAFAQND